ncbi:MAG: asparagine synthase (glutamine-hydrolyzing), partial [Hyphomicrobiales bacterium]|nr:asparagine synthase (glutamine-hydrolyzing) [Hyphomicrobiales bacterium]
MCGIAGLLDPALVGASQELRRLGEAMGLAIAHRGPDGAGLYVEAEAGLALAHRRLAIVDLSPAGAQPMVSADGRFVLVYNGELYNAGELCAHPALRGIAWRGHSDTEIMLESFARRGIAQTLADLNGMYALALFDRSTRDMHLVRDRLGIKPLFFARRGGGIYFASEMRGLLAAGIGGAIDPAALAAYLRFGYVPTPGAIFAGVEKLAPAEWCILGPDGAERRTRYWSLAGAVERGRADPLDLPDEAAVEALDQLLRDAVSRQMIADVPLGAFLSGGVDSSTIVAMMAAAGQGRVRTYSIGFPDLGFDESAHAAAVARHLGTEHTELVATEADALAAAPGLGAIYDEPFADSSQIPTYLVSRLTRANVTVALSGDGGDELFAGYNRYILAGARWPLVERIPRPLRRLAAGVLAGLPPDAVDATIGRLPGMPRQLGDKLIKAGSVVALDADGLYRRL